MKYRGFTIVELLIVIVVIAILAAIGIVAYGGVQGRAYNSAVQADLRQAKILFEEYYLDHSRYPSNGNVIGNNGLLTLTKSAYREQLNVRYCVLDDGSGFSISAYSEGGGRYYISHAQGVTELDSWSSGPTGLCELTLGASISGSWGYNSGWQWWVHG